MARMGGRRHLKRFAAPGYWPVAKKEYKWVVKPRPGPHPIEEGFPLLLVVRDILKLATTAKEAKRIIFTKKIHVDGKPRYDYKFQVGLMDVIEIPEINKVYRAVPDPYKFLKLIEIPKDESNLKLVKIIKKFTVRGGKIQLTTHDGRNFLLEPGSELAKVKPGYSMLIEVPSQEVREVFPPVEGATAVLIRGRRAGYLGIIRSIKQYVTFADYDNPELIYRGTKENMFVVGREEPALTLR